MADWRYPKEAFPELVYKNADRTYTGIRRFHPPAPGAFMPPISSLPELRAYNAAVDRLNMLRGVGDFEKLPPKSDVPLLTPYQKLYLWISHYLLGDKWA